MKESLNKPHPAIFAIAGWGSSRSSPIHTLRNDHMELSAKAASLKPKQILQHPPTSRIS
ncbi:hypothetical protein [Planococcus sp. YIM B11945]|uniref:hypothetical protein n=1 Tax=Planococcus sp. YIM B11945 TaxID=3435410 RepID=UPI003D7D7453